MTLLACRTFVWEWKSPMTTNKPTQSRHFTLWFHSSAVTGLWVRLGWKTRVCDSHPALLLALPVHFPTMLAAITQHCHDCLGISPAKLGVTKNIYLIYCCVANRNMKIRLLWATSMEILWFSLFAINIFAFYRM